jgi:diadenosine tetraphosphate (Ap4A) HIT family hydrolase
MDYDNLIIKRYPLWTLYLHQSQVYLGRCYLALNRDGNLDPFRDCTHEEKAELDEIIAGSLFPALARLFRPEMLNYDNLRNVWPHCHWHLITRYENPVRFAGIEFTDRNWGKNWSPYDREVQIPDTTLLEIRGAIATELDYRACDLCVERATWTRFTQFSGSHHFCKLHAEQETDFGAEPTSYAVWEEASTV